jgi:hypothetical protein
MALVIKDRIKETSTTEGTGTLTLAGASTGFNSFGEIGNGNTTYYAISDGTDWEVGIGTYTASGTTLSRDTVLDSSNSGEKVSWNTGTRDVFCTYPAEKAVYLDASGNFNISDGDITFGDNDKAIFGAGSDLQIYHDGNHSRLKETGTGSFYFDVSNSLFVRRNDTSALMASFETGVAKLYWDNNQKLATTSTGIDVTGTVEADDIVLNGTQPNDVSIQLTTSGDGWTIGTEYNANNDIDLVVKGGNAGGSFNEYLRITDSGNLDVTGTVTSSGDIFVDGGDVDITGAQPRINLHENDTTDLDVTLRLNGGDFIIETRSDAGAALGDRIRAASNGDISFYEDTGTTAKFFWDASAESLGIGTSSPDYQIDIEASSPTARLNSTVNNGVNTLWFGHSDDADAGAIRYWGSATGLGTYSNAMTFNTNGSQAMHIDSSGRVGIGTSSPTAALDVRRVDASGVIAELHQSAGFGIDVGSSQTEGYISTGYLQDFLFKTNSGSGQIERMRIDSSGRVGIGTSSPQESFHTTGNIRFGDSAPAELYTNSSELRLGVDKNNDNGASDITFYVDNSEKVRIDSSGNLDMTATGSGNIKIKNGNGIDFSASEGSGATSSILDDYEEGAWTPTVSVSNGMSINTSVATYTKIGNLCQVQARITFTGGSGTTDVSVNNFPFASHNPSGDAAQSCGPVYLENCANAIDNPICFISDGTTGFSIRRTGTTGSGTGSIFADNSTIIIFSFTYRTA